MIIKLTNDQSTKQREYYNELVTLLASNHPDWYVLDVGVGDYWDYSKLWKNYTSIDRNDKATVKGDICDCSLPNEAYDLILCNGVYEYVDMVGNMISEVWRMLKPYGLAVFGFVGPDYKYDGISTRRYHGEELFDCFRNRNKHWIDKTYCYITAKK